MQWLQYSWHLVNAEGMKEEREWREQEKGAVELQSTLHLILPSPILEKLRIANFLLLYPLALYTAPQQNMFLHLLFLSLLSLNRAWFALVRAEREGSMKGEARWSPPADDELRSLCTCLNTLKSIPFLVPLT